MPFRVKKAAKFSLSGEGEVPVEQVPGQETTSRRRLVQDSDDSESSDGNQIDQYQNLITKSSKEEKRQALLELAAKRKLVEEREEKLSSKDGPSQDSERKVSNASEKKRKTTEKPSRHSYSKMSKPNLKSQISISLKGMIAAATLSNDESWTKKRCREVLSEKIGLEQMQENMDFFRTEFDQVASLCRRSSATDLKRMVADSTKLGADNADGYVSSDLDRPLKISVEEKGKRKKKAVRVAKTKRSEANFKSQLSISVKRIIAEAALAHDATFTKKKCRAQLVDLFGMEQIERNLDFFREEFDKMLKYCRDASVDDLNHIVDSGAVISKGDQKSDSSGSDLDRPLQSRASKSKGLNVHSGEGKSSPTTVITEKAKLQGRREVYKIALERLIANGFLVQDQSLTKRICRERLKSEIGCDVPTSDIEFVNQEIDRINQECNCGDNAFVQTMAAQSMPTDFVIYFATVDEKEMDSEESAMDEDHDARSSGDDSDTSSLDLPTSSKRSKPRVKGIFSGIVIVPCGNELLKNEASLEKFRGLVESNGGKLQSCVTKKVNYVVIANGSYLKKNDSKAASARKYDAKLVQVSFFEECVLRQSLVNWTDHAAVHADSHSSAAKKAKTDKSRDDVDNQSNVDIDEYNHGDDNDSGNLMETEGNDPTAEKKSRRIAARKTKEESEWTKDVRARFSYVKDARTRAYDPKDPVVPEATFVNHKGIVYNTYLTHTEFDDRDEGLTKFFAIKLVEAGGLMKGERWHLVTQWGKVGASKPGCDVADFDDFKSALDAFNERFWEKTRNSWDSSSFAFRTVSGKYTMEELSDDEGDNDSSADESEIPCELDPRIQNVISSIFSTKIANSVLETLGIDTDKLDFQKLKSNVIRESYAELVSIQKILQRGDASKRSEKENLRLREHTNRIALLLYFKSEEGIEIPLIDGVNALKEKTRLVDDLRSISILKTAKKRMMTSFSASRNRLDIIYSGLRCHVDVVTLSSDRYHFISNMLFGTASTESHRFDHRLKNIFSVKRAGEDWRYAGFSELDNKMLLWRAARATSLVDLLLQGITAAPSETPAVGYPLGKGLYFYDSAAEAMAASGTSGDTESTFLILCEVALGNIHELSRPAYLRRAPHGHHSVVGKGVASFDPTKKVQFPGESSLQAVIGAPLKNFGADDSAFKCNHYVVYDVGQVHPMLINLIARGFFWRYLHGY
jgi:hypothetical protein